MSGVINNPGTKSGVVGGFDDVENTKLSTWAGTGNITTIGTVTSGGLGTGSVIDDPTITQGSDATGDTYYRAANGKMTRLAAGADGTVITSTGAGAVPAAEGVVGVVKKMHYFENTSRTAGNEGASDQFQITNAFNPSDTTNNKFMVRCAVATHHRGNDFVGAGLRFAKLGGSSYDYYNKGAQYACAHQGTHQGLMSYNFQVDAGALPNGTYAVYMRTSIGSSSPLYYNPHTSDDPRANPGHKTTLMIEEYKNP